MNVPIKFEASMFDDCAVVAHGADIGRPDWGGDVSDSMTCLLKHGNNIRQL